MLFSKTDAIYERTRWIMHEWKAALIRYKINIILLHSNVLHMIEN